MVLCRMRSEFIGILQKETAGLVTADDGVSSWNRDLSGSRPGTGEVEMSKMVSSDGSLDEESPYAEGDDDTAALIHE